MAQETFHGLWREFLEKFGSSHEAPERRHLIRPKIHLVELSVFTHLLDQIGEMACYLRRTRVFRYLKPMRVCKIMKKFSGSPDSRATSTKGSPDPPGETSGANRSSASIVPMNALLFAVSRLVCMIMKINKRICKFTRLFPISLVTGRVFVYSDRTLEK